MISPSKPVGAGKDDKPTLFSSSSLNQAVLSCWGKVETYSYSPHEIREEQLKSKHNAKRLFS